MAADLITEADKMRRVPGITFVDSPLGDRIARAAGTGLDVCGTMCRPRSIIGVPRADTAAVRYPATTARGGPP
jgi:hypothetical protein